MNAILLVITLTVLLITCLLVSKGDYLSPSVIFCASFLFSSIWALVYAEKWNFVMSEKTLCIIAGGVMLFAMVTIITKSIMNGIGGRFSDPQESKVDAVTIDGKLLFLLVGFEIIGIGYTVIELCYAAGTTNLTDAVHYYNNITKFTTDVVVFMHGRLLNLIWIALDAIGFWIAYAIASKTVSRKRPVPEFIVFSLSVASSFLRGARTTAVYKIIALICIYYLLLRKKNSKRFTTRSVMHTLLVVVAFIGFIASFKSLGSLMGRTITQSGVDYVALYAGSEIVNLDAYLKGDGCAISSLLDSQTLYALVRYIRPLFGFTDKVLLDLPARSVGGVTLSNVYTTFYQFYYDYGIFGIIIFTLFIAVVSQIVYEYAKTSRVKNAVPLSVIAYAYIFTTLALCFFSNKFYERVITPSFIYTIVAWIILNWCVTRSSRKGVEYKLSRSYRHQATAAYTGVPRNRISASGPMNTLSSGRPHSSDSSQTNIRLSFINNNGSSNRVCNNLNWRR